MDRTLSVVIPVHNVERYLDACLASVAAQRFDDFDVVVVDDGSTDASRAIADRFARHDRRFTVVHQRHRGLAAARNTGLEHTAGRYLAFVDSDDLLPDRAFATLVGSLEESGSDIACGGVQRFDRNGSWSSPLHDGVFDEPATGTHISRRTALIKDRTVWNKVYRRAFWNGHGFRFPHHPHEDAPVTVPAHVLARAVDVVTGPVYLWRQRDDGPLSTTQRLHDPANLEGRMKQVTAVAGFLAAADPALKRVYDTAALEHDILILLTAVPHVPVGYREEILGFVSSFVAGVEPGVLDGLSVDDRECYHLVRDGATARLIQLLDRRPQTAFL